MDANLVPVLIVCTLCLVIGVCVLFGMYFDHKQVLKWGRAPYKPHQCDRCKRPYAGEIEIALELAKSTTVKSREPVETRSGDES